MRLQRLAATPSHRREGSATSCEGLRFLHTPEQLEDPMVSYLTEDPRPKVILARQSSTTLRRGLPDRQKRKRRRAEAGEGRRHADTRSWSHAQS